MIRTAVSKEYIDLINDSPDPKDTVEAMQFSNDPVTFVEDTRIIKGRGFSFDDREYLLPIYRDGSHRIYIVKGRQTEFSEFLINMIIFNAWKYPGTVHLYLADRQSHTYKFSNHRMKIEAIKNSNKIQQIVELKNHNTTKMILKNGSIVYFQSAWNGFVEAESIPADFIYLDEIHNVDLSELPTLLESMSHSIHKTFYGVGIGGAEGSDWHKLHTSGKQFIWNQKAKAWIPKNPAAKYSSYHIPQTIVPTVSAEEIEEKRATYPDAKFQTHVMGNFIKGDSVPLSIIDMKKVLIDSLDFTMPNQVNKSLGPVTIGIDWGGGTKAFTVPFIAQFTDIQIPIWKILYTTRITDADTEVQIKKISNLIDAYEPDIGVQDLGGATRQMQEIDNKYGHIISKWSASAPFQNPYVYDKLISDNLIKVNHSYALQDVFDMIKRPHIFNGKPIYRMQIPNNNPSETSWIIDDFTSMYGELSKSASGQEFMKYSKAPDGSPNDSLMAASMNLMAFNLWKRNRISGDLAIGIG